MIYFAPFLVCWYDRPVGCPFNKILSNSLLVAEKIPKMDTILHGSNYKFTLFQFLINFAFNDDHCAKKLTSNDFWKVFISLTS